MTSTGPGVPAPAERRPELYDPLPRRRDGSWAPLLGALGLALLSLVTLAVLAAARRGDPPATPGNGSTPSATPTSPPGVTATAAPG